MANDLGDFEKGYMHNLVFDRHVAILTVVEGAMEPCHLSHTSVVSRS